MKVTGRFPAARSAQRAETRARSVGTINFVTFEPLAGQMLLWSAGTPSGIVAAPSPTVHCECAPTP